jgi:hypothetical protein
MHDEVADICRAFSIDGFWPEGWRQIHLIGKWRKMPLVPELEDKLNAIKTDLAPRTLADRVRGVVLHDSRYAFLDIGPREEQDGSGGHLDRMQVAAYELGKELVRDGNEIESIMEEIASTRSTICLEPFIKGVIEASSDHRKLWSRLVKCFHAADSATRSGEYLAYCLSSLRGENDGLVEEILEDSLADPVLAEWFPLLQNYAGMRDRGAERLRACLARNSASIQRYRSLSFTSDPLTDGELASVVHLIAERPDGFDVAVEILSMRISSLGRKREGPLPKEVVLAGRALLLRWGFEDRGITSDYELGEIARVSLLGLEAAEVVAAICRRVHALPLPLHFCSIGESAVFGVLLEIQPLAALSALFPDDSDVENVQYWVGRRMISGEESPFDHIPEDTLLRWCDGGRDTRYPLIASVICPFRIDQKTQGRYWTRVSLRLLENAPDRIEVLRRYIDQLSPTGGWGSLASQWGENATLLDGFMEYPDAKVVAFISAERTRLAREIAEARRREMLEETRENERFE